MQIYTDEIKLHRRHHKTNTAQMSELWVIAVTNCMRIHRETERIPGV